MHRWFWSNPLLALKILLMLTRNPSGKPWFGLQDCLGKLSFKQLGSLQFLLAIGISLQGDLTVVTLKLLPFHRMNPVYLSSDPGIPDLLDPMVAIVDELKRNGHDPSNPHIGSMMFRLLHSFCNAIPPEILKFTVRVRS
jgi:hypothetical protein